MNRLFPPIKTCNKPTGDGLSCELVANHPSWVKCRNRQKPKEEANPKRDGDPKIAGERPRENLAFKKRHRDGANYVPRHQRV